MLIVFLRRPIKMQKLHFDFILVFALLKMLGRFRFLGYAPLRTARFFGFFGFKGAKRVDLPLVSMLRPKKDPP